MAKVVSFSGEPIKIPHVAFYRNTLEHTYMHSQPSVLVICHSNGFYMSPLKPLCILAGLVPEANALSITARRHCLRLMHFLSCDGANPEALALF
jgi:hypothetical protein